MKLTIIFALSCLLSGCAMMEVHEPIDHKVVSQRIYNEPYENVWLTAVDWFADHNVTIDNVDMASGLITAKLYDNFSDSNYLDWGTAKKTSGWTYSVDQSASLNITVRKVGENRTKVNVNFFGYNTITAHEPMIYGHCKWEGHSTSTGKLEALILNYIGNRISQ